MSNQFRDKPSKWLMHNSMGFPDFLFTILTFSMGLLGLIAIVWLMFAIVAFFNAGSTHENVSLQVMENMQNGLVSMVGVIFSLAGGYVVRRYKKDDHYVDKKKLDRELEQLELERSEEPQAQAGPQIGSDLGLVVNEEDI